MILLRQGMQLTVNRRKGDDKFKPGQHTNAILSPLNMSKSN